MGASDILKDVNVGIDCGDEWEVDSVTIPLREIEPKDNYKQYERIGVMVIILKDKNAGKVVWQTHS